MISISREKGFTLIELLIVLSVISVLVGITMPRFKGMQDEANIAKVKSELTTIQTALESYYAHYNSQYPTALSTLTSATPQILSTIPNDPFAATTQVYQYSRGGPNNKSYEVHSFGLDGQCGAGNVWFSGNNVYENYASCIFISNAGRDNTGP